VQVARAAKLGFSLRDRLVGFLPRYAGIGGRLAPVLNLRDRLPPLARLSERLFGISARRKLPVWRRDRFRASHDAVGPAGGPEVVLWTDTFNATFERETIEAAIKTLVEAGYRVHFGRAKAGTRPLCCGRTFLSTGDVARGRAELSRSLAALRPFLARGVPVVGLEPSCLLLFRDEALVLLPGEESRRLAASAFLFEEFIVAEAKAGRFQPRFRPVELTALLHGHCHQKAFGAMGSVQEALRLIPGLTVETIESSCCGMAGAFGYQAETEAVSRAMGELSLLPAIRAASRETLLIADGTSCRHQIRDGAQREAVHVARVFAACLAGGSAMNAFVSTTEITATA
jgi:Fe-S oxidoreductase